MAYIIVEPCIGTKSGECVTVCPVDCIHPREDELEFASVEMLFIDPVTRIDCGACEAVCPVEAIYTEEDTPEKWQKYIQINADHYK